MPAWAPRAALWVALTLAWLNFLSTGRWASLPGALQGWKAPWYAAALAAATLLAMAGRRQIGRPVAIPGLALRLLCAAGAGVIGAGLLLRLPLSSWPLIPFWDDWPVIYQEAVNGVRMLRQGAVVGWNWGLLGGYPTSTEIAQSIALLAFLPMQIFGERIGFHLLHAIFFLSVPVFVWWDLRQEDRRFGVLAGAFAAFFAAGFYGTLARSGDTNSLAGMWCAGLALVGSRGARLGRRWGTPVMLLALTFGLYSHVAFVVYALIYLALESAYFRDRAAAVRLVAVSVFAGLAALPLHWEAIRYPSFLSVNNIVFDPATPLDWGNVARSLYYNVEILVLPHRWFNDYRSLANIWWPVMLVVAVSARRSRAGFYAAAAVLSQLLLRLNTGEFGVIFDRIMHMFPMLTAPALAGFVLFQAGTRGLAVAIAAVLTLYVQASFAPVPHVASVRDFNPPLVDRLGTLDGHLVLLEFSPHKDMDSAPERQSPKTPFDAHFEGLLPDATGKRFYGQMWDGWAWNVFRGQMVAAGTFRGQAIAATPPPVFEAEMRRWGVKHLVVWSDAMKAYLAGTGRFVERWRQDPWSSFELAEADVRSVVTPRGHGALAGVGFHRADVELSGVAEGDLVVVRTNFHPAWRARTSATDIPVFSEGGQLAFRAPASGSYTVHLEYPRRGWLSIGAALVFLFGVWALRVVRF